MFYSLFLLHMLPRDMVDAKLQDKSPWTVLLHVMLNIIPFRKVLLTKRSENSISLSLISDLPDMSENNHAQDIVPPFTGILCRL